MYSQDNNSLPVWIILSPAHHHISINSQPFLVGIVSPIRQNDQETMEGQGRRQESHQNGDKTRADSFSGSAGIQHSRPHRPTKGQTHATKIQIRNGICGPILRLHLCLPAKTPHQQRNGDGEARF